MHPLPFSPFVFLLCTSLSVQFANGAYSARWPLEEAYDTSAKTLQTTKKHSHTQLPSSSLSFVCFPFCSPMHSPSCIMMHSTPCINYFTPSVLAHGLFIMTFTPTLHCTALRCIWHTTTGLHYTSLAHEDDGTAIITCFVSLPLGLLLVLTLLDKGHHEN